MAAEQPGIDRSSSIEDLHHLRLMALLDEQVRDKGARQAAEDLGVDHRTLASSLESGQLSRRMRGALDRALLAGEGSPTREQRERNDDLAGRLDGVEEKVEEVGREVAQGLSAVQGEVKSLRNEQEQSLRRVEGRLDRVEGGCASVGSAPGSGDGGNTAQRPAPRLRREFPELVTVDPADDDKAVFGEAWGLIQEWRGLKDSHPNRGRGLDWLRVEERFLTVELALLEDHGLTLPPETYPLKGLDRSGQVNWRRKALEDTQEGRKRRELLLGLRRALTLGRWRG